MVEYGTLYSRDEPLGGGGVMGPIAGDGDAGKCRGPGSCYDGAGERGV